MPSRAFIVHFVQSCSARHSPEVSLIPGDENAVSSQGNGGDATILSAEARLLF
jgi:hypothetical protein